MQNVWHGGISYTIFLKSTICNRIGNFDEDLGVGANTLFGSAEETDYLIRCLNIDSKIYYMKKLRVYHPRKIVWERRMILSVLNYTDMD